MIRRPPRRRRLDVVKVQLGNIQCIDEDIDHASRIALVSPVIDAFRQQRRLRSICPVQRSAPSIPPAVNQENHSSGHVFAQPGSFFPVGLCPLSERFCRGASVEEEKCQNLRRLDWPKFNVVQERAASAVLQCIFADAVPQDLCQRRSE